jgi:hypothetical protein
MEGKAAPPPPPPPHDTERNVHFNFLPQQNKQKKKAERGGANPRPDSDD